MTGFARLLITSARHEVHTMFTPRPVFPRQPDAPAWHGVHTKFTLTAKCIDLLAVPVRHEVHTKFTQTLAVIRPLYRHSGLASGGGWFDGSAHAGMMAYSAGVGQDYRVAAHTAKTAAWHAAR